MSLYRPDYRVSLPRLSGTSKIYTKGCPFGCPSLPLERVHFSASDHGGQISCMEGRP